MNEAIANADQSIVDIAIQHCGSAEAAVEIATLNGISVTDNIVPGTILKLPAVANKPIVEYYAAGNIIPATALSVNGQKFEEQFVTIFE